MTFAITPSSLTMLGAACLITWRLYSRMRRLIGRQHLSRNRAWVTVCLFPLVSVLLAVASFAQPVNEEAPLAGIVVGAILGRVGLQLTKFEQTTEGVFYTLNAHIGIALSVLLGGRILYRIFQQLAVPTATSMGSTPQFASGPLTLAIVGTLAGYYVAYAIGLLRHSTQTPLGRSAASSSTDSPS